MSKRIALVGCGRHSIGNTLPSLRFTDLELAAVCDLDRGRAEHAERRFGAGKVYTDYKQMFEREELDGVVVVVHAKEHESIAIEAMKAGLHVLTEKPPSMDSEGAWNVVVASRKTGKVCMTAFKKRYAPAYDKARELAAKHKAGRRQLSLSYYLARYREPFDPAWAFILDACIHVIDLARFLLGEVARVCVFETGDARSHAYSVTMEYESGDVGTLNLASLSTPKRTYEKLEMTLDGGIVVVENVVELHYHANDRETIHELPSFSASGSWTEVTTGFAGEMQAFERLLTDGTIPPSEILSSYRSMALYEAIRGSRGRVTEVRCRE